MAPDAPVVTVDTEGAVSGDGPAGTADRVSTYDSTGSGPAGHLANYVAPGPPAVTPWETNGANGGTAHTATQEAAAGAVSLLNTLNPGTGGIPEANPAYRAPSGPVAASTKDTTLTDKQPGGSATTPVDSSNNMTSSPDSYSIGAAGSGTGTTAPAAPTSITAVTGPRGVTVGWAAPADPSGDKVLGYRVLCVEDDGVTFAPDGATSVFCDWLSPDRLYTFKVAAYNKKGTGPYSAASSPAVRPYNPDVVADPNNPNAVPVGGNPIYLPDGSIKPGTGGTATTPRTVTATAGSGGSKIITVNWTAPAYTGTGITGYHIVCSDGTTYDVSNVLTKAITFGASGGAAKTFTVQAITAAGPGVVSAPTTGVVSP